MRCMCCTHFQIFHGPHGCTAGPSSSDPCKCPGYEAPLGEGREAPSQAAVDDLVRAHADRGSKVNVHDIVPRETGGREAPMEACEMPASSGGAAWAATVEACARAAYAVGRKHWAGDPHWEHLPRVTIEHWRDVARAVLAAAGLPAKGAGR